MNGTSASSTRHTASPINAIRRAAFTGSIDTAIMIGSDTVTQATCQ